MFKRRSSKYIAITLLIACIFVLCSCSSTNNKIEQASSEQFFYRINDGEATITGFSDDCVDVLIPETVEGVPVTSIYPDSDKEYANIRSLSIPSSVNSVYDEEAGLIANGLYNLEKVTVAPGNKTFGSEDGMFYNKKTHTLIKFFGEYEKEELVIPDYIHTIRAKAFSEAKNIKTLVLEGNIKDIGEYAFKEMPDLKCVNISGDIEEIPDGAFSGCEQLEKVQLHSGTKIIGSFAFAYCANLEELSVPDSVNEIGAPITYNQIPVKVDPKNKNFESKDGMLINTKTKELLLVFGEFDELIIPSNIKSIAQGAINNELKKLTIGKNVTEIDKYAVMNTPECVYIQGGIKKITRDMFYDNKNLEELVLGEGIEEIKGGAFKGAEKLKKVIVPKSVNVLSSSAFPKGCKVIRK